MPRKPATATCQRHRDHRGRRDVQRLIKAGLIQRCQRHRDHRGRRDRSPPLSVWNLPSANDIAIIEVVATRRSLFRTTRVATVPTTSRSSRSSRHPRDVDHGGVAGVPTTSRSSRSSRRGLVALCVVACQCQRHRDHRGRRDSRSRRSACSCAVPTTSRSSRSSRPPAQKHLIPLPISCRSREPGQQG